MGILHYLYESFRGRHILLEAQSRYYHETTLKLFKESRDQYLFYDESQNEVLLLNREEMKIQYQNGNYRDYDELVSSFDIFCLNSCIEVLKEFSNFSFDEIENEFLNHNILKDYVFRFK